jgi:hypothetical protein
VRGILDQAGHAEAEIMVSGDLDEYRMDLCAGTPSIPSASALSSPPAPRSHMGAIYKMVDSICSISLHRQIQRRQVFFARFQTSLPRRGTRRDRVPAVWQGRSAAPSILLGGRLASTAARSRRLANVLLNPSRSAPALRQLEVGEPWPVIQSRELRELIGQTRSNLRG